MIRTHFAGGVSERGDMQKGSFQMKEGVRRGVVGESQAYGSSNFRLGNAL